MPANVVVHVVNEPAGLDKALRRLRREVRKTGLYDDIKTRERCVRKGEKRRQKRTAARRRAEKEQGQHGNSDRDANNKRRDQIVKEFKTKGPKVLIGQFGLPWEES